MLVSHPAAIDISNRSGPTVKVVATSFIHVLAAADVITRLSTCIGSTLPDGRPPDEAQPTHSKLAMAENIDPRLQSFSSLPPRSLAPQSYTSGPPQPLQNSSTPYYLPNPSNAHPALQSGPPQIDPALDQTSPTGPPVDESHDEEDLEEAHDTPGSTKSPHDLKRPRACDSCRGLKVRCDQERPDQSCKRCAKANRACITTPPTRKRQKKADSRVAELERKIDALTATLHAQKAAPEPRPFSGIPHYEAGPSPYAQPDGSFRAGSIVHDWASAPPAQERYPDIPPGYTPAQSISRAPEAKRRKVGDGSNHNAVRCCCILYMPH